MRKKERIALNVAMALEGPRYMWHQPAMAWGGRGTKRRLTMPAGRHVRVVEILSERKALVEARVNVDRYVVLRRELRDLTPRR